MEEGLRDFYLMKNNFIILGSLVAGLTFFVSIEAFLKPSQETSNLKESVVKKNKPIAQNKPVAQKIINQESNIRFKNFVVAKTSYSEAKKIILKDKIFSKASFSKGYIIKENGRDINLDKKLLLKDIKSNVIIFGKKSSISLSFYNDILSEINLDVDQDSYYKITSVLNDIHGYPTKIGIYKYPNIKQDYIELCNIWLPKEQDLKYSEYLSPLNNLINQCMASTIASKKSTSYFKLLSQPKNIFRYTVTYKNENYSSFVSSLTTEATLDKMDKDLIDSKKEVM